MEPLKVTFDLQSAMVEPEYPIHLDGLVAWASVDSAVENQRARPLEAQVQLPIERRDGIWCASALRVAKVASIPSTIAMTKKTDLVGLSSALDSGTVKKAPNKIPLDRGPWRQHLHYEQFSHVVSVEGWIIGDMNCLEVLLGRIKFLGALRRLGHGRISRMRIEKDERAIQRWMWRQMPCYQEGYLPLYMPLQPPYWNKSLAVAGWIHPSVV